MKTSYAGFRTFEIKGRANAGNEYAISGRKFVVRVPRKDDDTFKSNFNKRVNYLLEKQSK